MFFPFQWTLQPAERSVPAAPWEMISRRCLMREWNMPWTSVTGRRQDMNKFKYTEKNSHFPPWPYKFRVSSVLEMYWYIYTHTHNTICHKLKYCHFRDCHSWTASAAPHPESSCDSIKILMGEENRGFQTDCWETLFPPWLLKFKVI